ncbi:hypothetical protein, partial [Rhodopirellula bahusiensis]|uniref:hypothetical protein n=1 Tax=Rhodopirellula bahusiensis TaxID=2014065 RepID=UPI003263B09B
VWLAGWKVSLGLAKGAQGIVVVACILAVFMTVPPQSGRLASVDATRGCLWIRIHLCCHH